MTKRLLIPVFLTICFFSEAFAQMPKTVQVETPVPSVNGASSMICPVGVSAFAGTTTQALDVTAQSNDVEYLCFNDIINITHQGGQTFGDPDASSPPGIAYHFYDCPPTESGPDFATMITDPCIQVDPTTINGDPYIVTDPLVDINGNASLQNMGALQNLLNGGAPIELFFAPTTVDDWANGIYETDGMGGDAGPCINVNVNDAYRVVFLNEIEGANIILGPSGPCTASFEARGGLPEFENGTIYTNIDITLASDPTVVGTIPLPLNVTHGETLEFSVPQPGIYNVTIEDGRSCSATFQVDMNNCVLFNSGAGDVTTTTGSNVCVPISSEEYIGLASFQYVIEYDPTILGFDDITEVNIPDLLSFSNPVPGQLIVIWNSLALDGLQLTGDNVLYEVCFTAIGPNGSSSDINIIAAPGTPIEVSDLNGLVGHNFTNGSVTIGTVAFTLDFGVCTSQAGSTNGSFTVTPTGGGSAPYNVIWTQQGLPGNAGVVVIGAGETSGLVDNSGAGLPPGTYDVTVTDQNGDNITDVVVIPDLAPLSIQTTFTNPACVNTSDGCVDVNVFDGVAPYNIVWDVPGGPEVCDLPAANYNVTVTDGLGCVLTSGQSLIAPMLEITVNSQQNITCTGIDSGSISVTATGTNGPFSYQWDDANGTTTPDISGLPAGPVSVGVTDINNCAIVQNFTITAPILPVITSFDSVSVSCPNEMTGSLTVNAGPGGAGGAAISSYLWNDPADQTTATASMLTSGEYIVTVTDDVGCSVVDTASLYAPAPLTVDLVLTEPSCPTFDDGLIQLIIPGIVNVDYTVEWFDGNTFPVAPSLLCGEDNRYSVTITDINQCDTIVIDTFINCPPSINIVFDTASIEAVSCFGGIPCDGTIGALASGGTGTTGVYNFNWSSGEVFNGVSESTAAALCQGEQFVIVSDGFCPSDTAFITIPAPSPLGFDLANIDVSEPSCFGDSDGSAMVGGSGGNAPYTYQWGNPATSGPSIDGVPAGNYIVTVTDVEGCTNSITISVDQPDVFVAVLDTNGISNPTCFGGEDGAIAVSYTGGTIGTTTFEWSPNTGTTTPTAAGLAAGTYNVTVTDINGCSDDLSYTLTEMPPITAIIPDPAEPLCAGDQTVVTVESASGGNSSSHTFSVDFGPPQFLTSSIPILAGPHTVQVFDSLGCFTEYNINVDEPAPVTVLFSNETVTTIELELGSSVELIPTISVIDVPIDTILWDPLDHLDCDTLSGINDTLCFSPWVSPLETTTYEVTVIDTNGCVGSAEIIVEIDRNRNVFIPNAFSPNGDGVNDFLRVYTGVGVKQVNYFRIFDRWGEQVYETLNFVYSQNSQEGWDGRMNGKTMNSGIFAFIAEVEFVDGRVLLYRGDIALVR